MFGKEDFDIGSSDAPGAEDVQEKRSGHAVRSSDEKDVSVFVFIGIYSPDRIMPEESFFIHVFIIAEDILLTREDGMMEMERRYNHESIKMRTLR